MDTDMTYSETVKASEEAIKNTTGKNYFIPDSFNFKINDDFLYALATATKSGKEIALIYWFIKSMNKANIIHNVKTNELVTKAGMARATYYKCLASLQEVNLLVKLDKKTFMVNPEMVVNHRKSISKDRPQLLALWAEYQRQLRGTK